MTSRCRREQIAAPEGAGVPGDEEEPPPYEVLAALVASLRRELAGAVAALGQARADLARARERIAELEARLRQNSLLTEQRSVFSQLNGLTAVSGYTVTGHDRRAGTGPRGTGGAPGGQAGGYGGSV